MASPHPRIAQKAPHTLSTTLCNRQFNVYTFVYGTTGVAVSTLNTAEAVPTRTCAGDFRSTSEMVAVPKHYAVGGASNAICAWCGQGFSANNFHAVGSWSVAVPGSARFTTPGRSTGGRARAHESYYVQSLIPLPAARRLSPWPTSRRLCSHGCLARARAKEYAMLEEIEEGGAISRSTSPLRPAARSAPPSCADMQAYGLRSLSPTLGSSAAVAVFAPALADTSSPPSSKDSPGPWLGIVTVKIDSAVGLVVHAVGQAAESAVYDSFCVAAFGRQKRSTGLVKGEVNPHFSEELVFDVHEEDVPIGFLASPDRRQRKKADSERDVILEVLQAERRQRAALLRKLSSGQQNARKTAMLPAGANMKSAQMPWDTLGVKPGPNDCKISIVLFHQPADPALPLESLGQCSICALDLLRNGRRNSAQAVGRLTHPDPNMVARGIVHVTIRFKPAKECAALQPKTQDPAEGGAWHKHHLAGSHPRPRSVMRSLADTGRGKGVPQSHTGPYAQTNLLEDLPWKRVEHEAELKVKVRAWDKVSFQLHLSACMRVICLRIAIMFQGTDCSVANAQRIGTQHLHLAPTTNN